MTMPTFWLNPTDLVTNDPSLRISFPPDHGGGVITSTRIGDFWVSLGALLPFPARIDGLVVCYQIVGAPTPANSIQQTRLLALTAPGSETVLFDDPTVLASPAPVCQVRKVGKKAPDAALELSLRLHFQNTRDQIVLGGLSLQITELCANHRLLGEFGDYSTLDKAQAALQRALREMADQDGGVLCIPRDAPDGFFPRNFHQKRLDGPAVTVLDFRDGYERRFVPPSGTLSSSARRACHLIERDLAIDLDWNGEDSTELIESRYRGGASSYEQELSQGVPAGGGEKKFYVPTLRGLFHGQRLKVTGVAHLFEPPFEDITVDKLGVDATGPFFTATDSTIAHPQAALVYNKNVVNGLTVGDVSNCDNQSSSVAVFRTTYGLGDSFVFTGILTYQGDIISAGGDEGGVGFAAEILHDLDCFWGLVESWDASKRELVYQAGATNPQKLGTSRPLINMREGLQVTDGKVLVVGPGYDYLRPGAPSLSQSLVVGRGVAWDRSLVGRFFAIDEPTEIYRAGEAGNGRDVHRWWHITDVKPRADGMINLFVQRTTGLADRESGPTLFRFDNYSLSATEERELSYVIRPGAWVSDVRRGVNGDEVGSLGVARVENSRVLVLAPQDNPAPTLDFRKDDPITNAVGPDPLLPVAFRARHHDNFPSATPVPSFVSQNAGRVQLGAGFAVIGAMDTADQKDGNPPFLVAFDVLSATEVALRVMGPVAADKGAIEFWQPNGNPHKIRWLVKDKHGHDAEMTFHADPLKAIFRLMGGPLDLGDMSTLRQSGLSATGTEAKNLRDIGVSVPATATTLKVFFPHEEDDTSYALFLQCSWPTRSVVTKRTDGFDATFSDPAPAGGGLIDWLLVR
jgi:hypothetical protein